MTILEKAKAAADEYADTIGGVWVVLGNPKHTHLFTKMRDVSIIDEASAADFKIPGDEILYSTGAV